MRNAAIAQANLPFIVFPFFLRFECVSEHVLNDLPKQKLGDALLASAPAMSAINPRDYAQLSEQIPIE